MNGAEPRAKPDNLLPLLLGFGILAAMLLGIVWFLQRQVADYKAVRQSVESSQCLYRLFSALQDAETGQRGYQISGIASFLDPYNNALPVIAKELVAVKSTIGSNADTQKPIADLEDLIEQRLESLQSAILYHDSDRPDEALALIGIEAGKNSMDRIRNIVTPLINARNDVVESRFQSAARAASWLTAGAIAATAFGVFLALVAVQQAQRQLSAISSSVDVLSQTNQRLVAEAAHGVELASQLRQSQKMEAIGQLTGGLAHDFNNMLAVIVSSLGLIKRRIARGDTNIDRYIDSALDGADRAATLTHRLLAFARQQPLAPVSLDSNRMVGGMSELLRRTLGEGVRLETALSGGLWRTRADPSQLENAILNLAVNARDAMPKGGRLTIETSNAHLDDEYVSSHVGAAIGQYVLIAVTDTGAGICREVIDRVFDPFFTTKPPGQGTGLGLSQVFGFIKQSGGHIAVYSELSHGTSVKMYLPRYYGADESCDAMPSLAASARGGAKSEVILVVEDDDRVRQLTVDALMELGYTVLSANGGPAALDSLAEATTVDLLFTDIVMPDLNGRDLARQAIKLQPGLKVLFTTGYAPNAVVHNATLEPGEDLIGKPFQIEQLGGKVREVLDRPAVVVKLPMTRPAGLSRQRSG